MGNKMDYNNMPLQLGLAITSNRPAMDQFVDMTDDEKEEFIERRRSAMSKSELDEMVGSLVKEDGEPDLHLEDVNNIFKGTGVG